MRDMGLAYDLRYHGARYLPENCFDFEAQILVN